MDMAALKQLLGADTACVYLENPNFLGVVEPESGEICAADAGSRILFPMQKARPGERRTAVPCATVLSV